MGLGNVTNSITSISQNIRSTLNKVNGIFSTDSTNGQIRDRYNGGFYGDTTQFPPNVFARLFDEPTYLTFRIEFDFSPYKEENLMNVVNANNLNFLPEPLFSIDRDRIIMWQNNTDNSQPDKTHTSASVDEDGNATASVTVEETKGHTEEEILADNVSKPYILDQATGDKYYSTYRYLKYALGESKRADMLAGLISSLHDITYNYPYYFTELEGLNSLSKVNPAYGQRISSENGAITLSCIEGLDLKITQLMQLYRKIAWDDVYQRWILPDMMRFFSMNIYVSEMRLFHTKSRSASLKNWGKTYDLNAARNATSIDQANNSSSFLSTANSIINTALGMSSSIFGSNSGFSKFLNGANDVADTVSSVKSALTGNLKLCNNAINDVMPTIVYHCHLCEFDIEDTLSHISKLSSSKSGLEAAAPSIKIKIGRVMEEMLFPLQIGLNKAEDSGNNKFGYGLGPDVSPNIQNKLFDDFCLQLESTGLAGSRIYNDDITPTGIGKRINSIYDGKHSWSAAETSMQISRSDDAYDPMSADKTSSIIALTGSIAGLFTKHESVATDSDYVNNVKNSSNGNSQKLQSSSAVSNKIVSTQEIEIDNPYVSTANENKIVNPYDSSDKNEQSVGPRVSSKDKSSFISYVDNVTKSLGSTATNQKYARQIQSLIDQTGPEEVLSAATSLKSAMHVIEEEPSIKSVATNPEITNALKSKVAENVINQIVSNATDEDSPAVKALANMIIDNAWYPSTATHLSAEQIGKIKSGFSYLN